MGCNLSEICSKGYVEDEEQNIEPKKSEKSEVLRYKKIDSTESTSSRRSSKTSTKHHEPQSPKHLRFLDDIELISHSTHFITFERNPLEMEFLVPSHVKIMFSVFDHDRVEIASNSVLVQRSQDPSSNKTLVYVALPQQNKTYFLKMYAKNLQDDEKKTFQKVAQFKLVRSGSNENDDVQFCRMYDDEANHRCYVHSPVQYSIRLDYRQGDNYEFKYSICGARQVVFVDDEDTVYDLEKSTGDQEEPAMWTLNNKEFSSQGNLTLFARFNEANCFTGICSYQIVRTVRVTRL